MFDLEELSKRKQNRMLLDKFLLQAMEILKNESCKIKDNGYHAKNKKDNPYQYFQIGKRKVLECHFQKFLEHQKRVIWLEGFYKKELENNDIGMCKTCGKKIITKDKRRQFCSVICKWNYYNNHRKQLFIHVYYCRVCGNKITQKLEGRRTKIYCSKECKLAENRMRLKGIYKKRQIKKQNLLLKD